MGVVFICGRAYAVWRYSRSTVAAYIWGDSLGDSAADTVLQALRAAGTAGMTRTNISALFDRHKGSQDLARVLNLLLERKLASVETRKTEWPIRGSLAGHLDLSGQLGAYFSLLRLFRNPTGITITHTYFFLFLLNYCPLWIGTTTTVRNKRIKLK